MATNWLTATDTIDPTGPYTEEAIQAATLVLYKLTAEKYHGETVVTEAYNSGNYSSVVTQPAVINGQMCNIPGLTDGFRNLKLRHSPVREIIKIESQGRVWDPSEYSLRNNSYVVRANSVPWILTPTTDLLVTYKWGTNPPAMGKRAAIRLANEIIRHNLGDEKCALPERVTSVSRQGVSYTVFDPITYIQQGKTGIYEVDLFIASVNPTGAKKRPKVFNPDQPRGERIQ